jgi:hypothetical protein
MSDNAKSDKFPTAVVVTAIICGTILLLTVAGMIWAGIMSERIIKELPDNLPNNITVQFR